MDEPEEFIVDCISVVVHVRDLLCFVKKVFFVNNGDAYSQKKFVLY